MAILKVLAALFAFPIVFLIGPLAVIAPGFMYLLPEDRLFSLLLLLAAAFVLAAITYADIREMGGLDDRPLGIGIAALAVGSLAWGLIGMVESSYGMIGVGLALGLAADWMYRYRRVDYRKHGANLSRLKNQRFIGFSPGEKHGSLSP